MSDEGWRKVCMVKKFRGKAQSIEISIKKCRYEKAGNFFKVGGEH